MAWHKPALHPDLHFGVLAIDDYTATAELPFAVAKPHRERAMAFFAYLGAEQVGPAAGVGASGGGGGASSAAGTGASGGGASSTAGEGG